MIKISEVVKKLFLRSDTAQLAANEGILNVSAWARLIQPQVSALAMKEVTVGTITVALYRILSQYSFKNFKPSIVLTELTVHSAVTATTYDRTPALLGKLPLVLSQLTASAEKPFFTITQGPDEVTIIADSLLQPVIVKKLGKPSVTYKKLAAISTRFSKTYLEVPNMMYSLFASLAVRRVNVMEVVSTLTSLTFVVYQTELNKTLEALKPHLNN